MKKFMIGSSNFEQFIKSNYAYVDKTEIIYKLVNDTMGRQFFLSRPRRFGKSLLLSTIKYMFQGRRDLFKGLKIESLDFNWDETYPILHLNMNECTGSIERVREKLSEQLKALFDFFGVNRDETMTLSGQFSYLINKLAESNKNNQIVLLVDEYDKPLLDHIGTKDVLPYQTFLKEFYTVIKDTEQYQRFTLITGVSKFSHVSIFSGLNNLVDLTMHPVAATLLGYSHEEMHFNFKENIQALAEANNLDYDGVFQRLIDQYDGYCFDEELIKVFNPVSIANAFMSFKIKNYWFATGTPGWLVGYLKTKPFFYTGKIIISDIKLNSYNPEDPDVVNLLLQTGYLTVVDTTEDFEGFNYTLDFPNNEVRLGFSEWLACGYISQDDSHYKQIRRNLVYALNDGDVDKIIKSMKAFYASLPYDMQDKMKVEQAYQLSIAILIMYLGFNTHAEFRTNKGRMDILIQSPDYIYIIEMKLDKPAREAIDQIHEKGYYEQFNNSATLNMALKNSDIQDININDSEKKVFLMGLSFSSEEKNITEHIIEEL